MEKMKREKREGRYVRGMDFEVDRLKNLKIKETEQTELAKSVQTHGIHQRRMKRIEDNEGKIAAFKRYVTVMAAYKKVQKSKMLDEIMELGAQTLQPQKKFKQKTQPNV